MSETGSHGYRERMIEWKRGWRSDEESERQCKISASEKQRAMECMTQEWTKRG